MAGWRAAAALVAAASVAGCTRQPQSVEASNAATLKDSPRSPAVFQWRLPAGFPVPVVPADNPMSDAKVALGRLLFHDTRLSGNRTFSCASCHQQAHAFTDGRPHAMGSTGASHPRSTMTLANVAYNASLGWADDRLRTLEAQTAVPMFNEHPVELGIKGRETEVAARFAPEAGLFRDAFPGEDPVRFDQIVKALAAFERTLISGESPLDAYLYRDDKSGMSENALRGMKLFFSERLGCSNCHSGFNLSGPVAYRDARPAVKPTFHNTALYNIDGRGAYPAVDRGLIDVTRRPDDMGRFRAPTLRNIALTAPYMHDGSVPTLEAAVMHYASGGVKSPLRSRHIRGFQIAPSEIADLVSFLHALTDQKFVNNPAFGVRGS